MTARAPFFAGFESARLHWNGHDTLSATGHLPQLRMAQNIERAVRAGAVGIRDCLPMRHDPAERIACAMAVLHPFHRAVWDLVHFCQPDIEGAVAHAQRVGEILPRHHRLIAVNEPSVGWGVAGIDPEGAVRMARRLMDAAACSANGAQIRFWTCDPMHHLGEGEWWATDRLVRSHGDVIEAVGVNYYPIHSTTPLREILRKTADRYGKPVALTETGWHDGHARAMRNFPGIATRREWWDHVLGEIDAAGVPLECACWFPFLDTAWEPAEAWPNGWQD